MDFHSVYDHGFARVAACTVPVRLVDPGPNAAGALAVAPQGPDGGGALPGLPSLGLTGYSLDDLVLQDALLDAVEAALAEIVTASRELLPVLIVGAPLRARGRVFNCAVVVHRGRVLGVAPKSYLPTYREFYEARTIAAGDQVRGTIRLGGALPDSYADSFADSLAGTRPAAGAPEVPFGPVVPFGPDLRFPAVGLPDLVLHA